MRVSLFYKILVANGALLLFGVAAGLFLIHFISPGISASTAFFISVLG